MAYGDFRRVIHIGCVEIIVLVSLPLTIRTKEEAARYFEKFEAYRPAPDEYENQMYTKRYKLFQRGGRWMAYHWIGFD